MHIHADVYIATIGLELQLLANSLLRHCRRYKIFFLTRWFLTATSGTKPIIVPLGMFIFSCTKKRKEEVPFSMAIGNGELMHKCFPKHSRMGTARMK